MPIEHTGPEHGSAAPDQEGGASIPEQHARACLHAAHAHPLDSAGRRALLQEAAVHAGLANIWATEAVLTRLEELHISLVELADQR